MNDPHVVALLYSVEHDASVDYSEAQPLDCDHERFRIGVRDKQVRLELKEHYATEDAARNAVERYIRAWELEAGLCGQPGRFNLRFQRAEIVDRNPPPPTPGLIEMHLSDSLTIRDDLRVTVSVLRYPPPPSELRLDPDNPDVSTMYQRYKGYLEDREPLASMAYFCLTVLEYRFKGGTRKEAASWYRISRGVLDKIAKLTTQKGGQSARKAAGIDKELTGPERRFLEEAVRKIILRAAEVAQDPDQHLPKITLSDLPRFPPDAESA